MAKCFKLRAPALAAALALAAAGASVVVGDIDAVSAAETAAMIGGVAVAARSSSGVAASVAIQPGATAFTVTPCAATSNASAWVRPTIAALAAE